MALEVQLSAQISGTETSALDLATAQLPINLRSILNFANGAGADQASKIFTDERTLSASGDEDLDLSGGLTDAFGNSIALTKLKGLLVIADSDNTNDVVITRPASNGVPLFSAASDAIPVKPKGFFFWAAPDAGGITVTASTGDLLNLSNSAGGTSVTYKIVIIGS